MLGKHPRDNDSNNTNSNDNNNDKNHENKSQERVENGQSINQDSDPDDVGPMPLMPSMKEKSKKKKKVLPHEHIYLSNMPTADRYFCSYMHRDVVNYVTVTKTNFIITTSIDGHVKFWKKKLGEGIEFVKHYKAHIGSIQNVAITYDGLFFATVASGPQESIILSSEISSNEKIHGGGIKIFDVINFDMINVIPLDYDPNVICWIHEKNQVQVLLAVSDTNSPNIFIYDGRGDGKPIMKVNGIHNSPIITMAYNPFYNCVISADKIGNLEYWTPIEPFDKPTRNGIFDLKSNTDLFEFRKSKSFPYSIVISPTGNHFITMSNDRQVRLFRFKSGKLIRKYDESLKAISEMQQAGTSAHKLDDMEFGRRLALEKELEKFEIKNQGIQTSNAIFDESGNFILYATILGIKIVNTITNRVVRILGKDETHRFLNLSIYQGAPLQKSLTTFAMAASDNPLLNEQSIRDPILFSSAFKRSRFYMFGQVDGDTKDSDRDVFNEKPTREEQALANVTLHKDINIEQYMETIAILHTTKGDIILRLFPQYAPKAVENFITLSKQGYYDGVIFHRVIKRFMIQTGDPLGDGTGGESKWGQHFQDEFHPDAKHDKPYTLSMANAGKNTNGSQFFITTVRTPHLDNKHTVFGRAVGGMDVIHSIENVKTTPSDRPRQEIKILNVTVRQ